MAAWRSPASLAIELVTSAEKAVTALEREQADALALRQKLADVEEAHRASEGAVQAADTLIEANALLNREHWRDAACSQHLLK